MASKIWLEVAINGPMGPAAQPGIPLSRSAIVAEAVACARAGAAIVHFHPYDEDTGRPSHDVEACAATVEEIRSRVDAIVYPVFPADPSADSPWAGIERLAERGLLEWLSVDPGSVNVTHRRQVARDRNGQVYTNTDEHIHTALALAERFSLTPTYACYEPGFVRHGAALATRHPRLRRPVYRFMFSGGFTFGLPAEGYALDTYAKLLAAEAPGCPAMIAGYDVDVLALAPDAARRGIHLRVGLEDAPFGETRSNEALAVAAVSAIARVAAEPASAAEVRAACARDGGA